MKFKLKKGYPRKINIEYIRPEKPLLKAKEIKETELGTEKIVQSKPLFLILERIYFNEIIEGTKTEEYRDDSEFYRSRFLSKDRQNFKNYESVIFQEGYRKDARRMTVEIKKIILDDIFTIKLGKIIETNF